MAQQSLVSALVQIGGKIAPSLPASVKYTQLQMLALQKSILTTNATITGFGSGLVKKALGLVGIVGLVEVFKHGLDIAKEEGAVLSALNNLVKNQNALKGIGVEQSKKQVEEYVKQSEALQQSTGIYAGIFLKGDAVLRQYKLSNQEILKMQPALADLFNYQLKMGASAETLADTYTAIGRAIETGQARGLKTVGIELDANQQKLLKLYASVGLYAEAWRMIIKDIEQQHGGAAKESMGTLGGQAGLAMSNIKTFFKQLGDPLVPFVKLAKIIVSKFIAPLGEHFTELNHLIDSQWKSWVRYIDTSLIPTWKKWIDQGWTAASKAIKFFADNSKWLLPWLGNAAKGFAAWTFVIAPLIKVIGTLRVALIALGTASPWMALATGAILAAGYVISNWDQVKKWFSQFFEWIAGSKVYSDTFTPKALAKGSAMAVKRALPIQKGLWGNFLDWLKPDAKTQAAITDLAKTVAPLIESISKGFTTLLKLIQQVDWIKLIKDVSEVIRTALCNAIQTLDTVVNALVVSFQKLREAWEWFTTITPKNAPRPTPNAINQLDPNRPGGPLGPPLPPKGLPGHIPWKPGAVPQRGLNLTHFGGAWDPYIDSNSLRGEGKFSPKPYSMLAGTSAALLAADAKAWGLKPNQTFMYQGRQFRYDDQIPARYKDKYGRWHTMSRGRIDIYDPANKEFSPHTIDPRKKPVEAKDTATITNKPTTGDITINYNPTINVHGTLDTHILAEHHNRAVQKLRDMMAEVVYLNKRASFVNQSGMV